MVPDPERGWPYWPVLRHPVLRVLLPGIALSSIGDGMGIVAVALLALRLAPASSRGLWVGASVAAYALPGVLGAAVFGRLLSRRPGAQVAQWDATVRVAALGTVPLAFTTGLLTPPGYIALLAVSSLLHVWGSAGVYGLVAQVLPEPHRLAGNALVSALGTAGFIAGPALAGLLVGAIGPAWVIGLDAVTFAALAASFLLVRAQVATWTGLTAGGPPSRAGASSIGTGWRVIIGNRGLLGLTVLTIAFFFMYGPVEVALPIRVIGELHRSPATLGGFWTLFAIGEVSGGFVTAYLRRLPLWPVACAVVLGWGACLLPLGCGAPVGLAMAGFALGGFIYAPYPAVSVALCQRVSPPEALTSVLATRGAIMVLATPSGTLLGGALVAWFGARQTLLLSGLTTIGLGVLATLAGVASSSVSRVRSRHAPCGPGQPGAPASGRTGRTSG